MSNHLPIVVLGLNFIETESDRCYYELIVSEKINGLQAEKHIEQLLNELKKKYISSHQIFPPSETR
jgi:hypothetical protein